MSFFQSLANGLESGNPRDCYGRPKIKFLFFFSRYQGHQSDEEATTVAPWGSPDWHYYTLTSTCKHCGVTKSAIVDEQDLSRIGLLHKVKRT